MRHSHIINVQYNIRNLKFRCFYSLVIDLETEKGKTRASSSTSMPEKETTPQPVVDDADGKLSDKYFFVILDSTVVSITF